MPLTYDASRIDEIVEHILDLHNRTHGRVLIALAGIPGAGKSTLSTAIAEQLTYTEGIRTVVLPQDGYHYYLSELEKFEDSANAIFKRGAAFTFNATKFVKFILELRSTDQSTETLWAPSFDHRLKDPVEHDVEIGPRVQVVIIEGNYVALKDSPWNQIESMVDETWFCTAPLEVVRGRIIGRHLQAGISRNAKEAADRVDRSDLVNARYILEHSKACDVVINND